MLLSVTSHTVSNRKLVGPRNGWFVVLSHIEGDVTFNWLDCQAKYKIAQCGLCSQKVCFMAGTNNRVAGNT